MRKTLLSAVSILALSTTIALADNDSTVTQTGAANTATVTQNGGSLGVSTITQDGDNGEATVKQSDDDLFGNLSTITQSADADGAIASVTQNNTGAAAINTSTINQATDGNATVNQKGEDFPFTLSAWVNNPKAKVNINI